MALFIVCAATLVWVGVRYWPWPACSKRQMPPQDPSGRRGRGRSLALRDGCARRNTSPDRSPRWSGAVRRGEQRRSPERQAAALGGGRGSGALRAIHRLRAASASEEPGILSVGRRMNSDLVPRRQRCRLTEHAVPGAPTGQPVIPMNRPTVYARRLGSSMRSEGDETPSRQGGRLTSRMLSSGTCLMW
jgi:hypothetical protein